MKVNPIFIKTLAILCLMSLVACKQDKNKQETKKVIETESVKKPAADNQKAISELNQELEDFDQQYSTFLKGFYQSINEVNAFTKDAVKDDDVKKRILKDLSQQTKSDQHINVPKNLKSEYQSSVDTLAGIYSEFRSLKEELKDYVESEVWRENKRSQIYEFGEKAAVLSRKYEHTYNRLNAKLQ